MHPFHWRSVRANLFQSEVSKFTVGRKIDVFVAKVHISQWSECSEVERIFSPECCEEIPASPDSGGACVY